MRTNELIHLYEMAGDKSHSSFLMWTVSGCSHTQKRKNNQAKTERQRKREQPAQGFFRGTTHKNGHGALSDTRIYIHCVE